MANIKDDNSPARNSSQPLQGSINDKGSEKTGNLLGILAFLTAIVIIVAVLAGVSYFVLSNNIGGLAERYDKQLRIAFLLKHFLPPAEKTGKSDYYDNELEKIENISIEELRRKYLELVKANADLNLKITELNKTVDKLSLYKTNENKARNQLVNEKKKLDEYKKNLDQIKLILEADEKSFQKLIAEADLKGFSQYYQRVEKEIAQEIYKKAIIKQQQTEELKNFVKLYEGMETENATAILELMVKKQSDLVAEIIGNMGTKSAAEIIGAMSPENASAITIKLRKRIDERR